MLEPENWRERSQPLPRPSAAFEPFYDIFIPRAKESAASSAVGKILMHTEPKTFARFRIGFESQQQFKMRVILKTGQIHVYIVLVYARNHTKMKLSCSSVQFCGGVKSSDIQLHIALVFVYARNYTKRKVFCSDS